MFPPDGSLAGPRRREGRRTIVDMTSLNNLLLFAEQKAAEGGGRGLSVLDLLPWVAIFVVFYLLLIRPQQKERARRQEMLGGLKKNDRVIAAGGIFGVVAEVDREANRVTLKVDEATNAKLRVTLSSVVPLGAETPAGGDKGTSP